MAYQEVFLNWCLENEYFKKKVSFVVVVKVFQERKSLSMQIQIL